MEMDLTTYPIKLLERIIFQQEIISLQNFIVPFRISVQYLHCFSFSVLEVLHQFYYTSDIAASVTEWQCGISKCEAILILVFCKLFKPVAN